MRTDEKRASQAHQAMQADLEQVRADVREWLARAWRPGFTLREWWAVLAESGWAAASWPRDWCGRALPRSVATIVVDECIAAGVPGPPWGVAYDLAGPLLIEHGTDGQRRAHVLEIAAGRESWCQLFSEPAAGSDLAAVRTSARRDKDGWVISGQKVWTTLAHHADFGMLLARTDPDVPKHLGISWFMVPMDRGGIEVRPLRQMNGQAEFNEVFLENVRVPAENLVGGLNRGWPMAKATMALARAYNPRRGTTAEAGARAGCLDRPAAEFAVTARGAGGRNTVGSRLIPLAASLGRACDPLVRQDLARVYILNQVRRFNHLRLRAAAGDGQSTAVGGKITALATAQLAADVGMRVLGPYAMLGGADAPADGLVEDMLLIAPSIGIAGGTNNIVRNVLAERVLGLPREPDSSTEIPFKDLPTGV
jgi:alkylation response protein AidB-like acyl-CoA dehydrogenase